MKARDLQTPFKTGAGCLIVCKETERFLLIQRSDYVPSPLTWSLPGGGVESGEAPEAAARRELFEEINFNSSNIPMKLIYTNDVYAPKFRFYTYACLVENEFEPKLNWESNDYVWCDVHQLPSPLHWGVEQLFNFNQAAEILLKFADE